MWMHTQSTVDGTLLAPPSQANLVRPAPQRQEALGLPAAHLPILVIVPQQVCQALIPCHSIIQFTCSLPFWAHSGPTQAELTGLTPPPGNERSLAAAHLPWLVVVLVGAPPALLAESYVVAISRDGVGGAKKVSVLPAEQQGNLLCTVADPCGAAGVCLLLPAYNDSRALLRQLQLFCSPQTVGRPAMRPT